MGKSGSVGVRNKKMLSAEGGQVRMFEVVIAAMIIFSVFSASIFLMYPSSAWVLHEKEDLDRLGYNILHSLIETDAVESILAEGGENAAYRLKILIERIISPSVYYDLTIFKCEDNGNIITLSLSFSVSNMPPDGFSRLPEKSSTMTIYTSRSGETYYIILVLTRGR